MQEKEESFFSVIAGFILLGFAEVAILVVAGIARLVADHQLRMELAGKRTIR